MPRPIRFVLWGLPFHVGATFFLAGAGYAAWIAAAGFPFWMSAIFLIMFFLSVVVHELGHAVALRALGVRHDCVSVNVHALGGHVTYCESCHARLNMLDRFAVSVAGPIAGFSLAFAAAVLCVLAKTDVMFLLASELVVVNVATNVMNLLPTFPLDGGRATDAVLRGIAGGRAFGAYAAIAVSGACLVTLVVAGVWYGMGQGLVGQANIALNLSLLAAGNLARVRRSD